MPDGKLTRFRWERAVLSDAGPRSSTTRHVLLTLATHAKNLEAWPSIRTLMNETQFHEHAVIDAIRNAIDLGWLARQKIKTEGKDWRRSIYRLIVPAGVVLPATPARPDGVAAGATGNDANGVALSATAQASHGVALKPDGVAPEASLVLHEAQSNNVLNMNKNIKTNRPGVSDTAKTEHDKELERLTAEARQNNREKAHEFGIDVDGLSDAEIERKLLKHMQPRIKTFDDANATDDWADGLELEVATAKAAER